MKEDVVTCKCYDSLMGMAIEYLRYSEFAHALTKTPILYQEKPTTREELTKRAETLKTAIEKAVDCGMPMGGIAPIASGIPLTELVDRTLSDGIAFRDSHNLDVLADGVWDNLISISPCIKRPEATK